MGTVLQLIWKMLNTPELEVKGKWKDLFPVIAGPVCILAVALQTKFSLSSKFSRKDVYDCFADIQKSKWPRYYEKDQRVVQLQKTRWVCTVNKQQYTEAVFFKVFKRLSIPFSLLCLILLTDFHKNASFRPNMLIQIGHSLLGNKLQTISYTKRFNEGLHTHSFSRFHAAFSLGRVARAAAVGGPGIPRDQQQSQIVLLAPHQDGTKQGRRCSHVTWSLDKLWAALPLVFSVAWWT